MTAYALMETPFLDAGARYGLIAAATLFLVLLLVMSTSVSRLMNESLHSAWLSSISPHSWNPRSLPSEKRVSSSSSRRCNSRRPTCASMPTQRMIR